MRSSPFRLLLRLRASAILALIVGCVVAAPASPLRLACVGDSITDGYQMPDKPHNAYPAQLARLLGAEWEVRNFGVSGACLMRHGGYPYHQQSAYAAALEWKPDIVVVALGTNDTKTENIATHPDDFVPSYRALLADFRTANPDAKIFLCLQPPAFPAAMGIADSVLTQEILPRIREVAQSEKLPLIDLHTPLADASELFPDKIHPTAEGAAFITREI